MSDVLIIEDDLFLAKAYVAELTALGISSSILLEPEIALNTIKSEKPKLVVLDVVMPTKDGFEVLRDIRSNEDTKKLKVVLLTKLKGEKDRALAKDLGEQMILLLNQMYLSMTLQIE